MIPINGGVLGKEHSHIISQQELSLLIPDGFESEERNEVNIYVECQDVNGNPSAGSFVINFCVYPIDLTAPIIVVTSPETEWIAFGTETQQITVVTNEPAEIKWSYEDREYDLMDEKFVCNEDGSCTADIAITGDETKICIKARDHPEFVGTDREDERNTNGECTWFSLKRTKTELKINSVKPEKGSVIKVGLELGTVELKAETSGGYEGTASCSYSLNMQPFILFNAPIGNEHSVLLNRITAGNYDVKIACVDSAGNDASAQTNFKVEKDTSSPKVTRVYSESGSLVVITNEPGTCSFVNAKPEGTGICGFKIDDGELMSGSGTQRHATNFDTSKVYYIRCKDDFGNTPTKCLITVGGGDF